MQQAVRVGFVRVVVTAQYILGGKAFTQADGLEGDMGQFLGIAGQNAQATATGRQVAHQLNRTRRGRGGLRQFAFMLQQPGMLGRRHLGRQAVEVGEDIGICRDFQLTADQGKIMHGNSQGAVHVKNPVLDVLECHAQSLRWRIKPSCVTDATSWPARL